MRKLFKERKLFKRGNYMRKYGIPLKSAAHYLINSDSCNTILELNIFW